MTVQPKRAVQNSNGYGRTPVGRSDFMRLDLGESSGAADKVLTEIADATDISIYPDYCRLYQKLSDLFEVPSNYLHLTNGSDEGLVLIASTFIEPGEDTAVISWPCFIVLARALELAGARVRKIRVRSDLSFDLEELEAQFLQKPKLCMLATPDNPTGALLDAAVIARWLEQFPDTLFVIDEAYFEYSGMTVLNLAGKHENLLVTRTFSKVWGMAGLRLGIIIGAPSLIDHLKTMTLPFNVNSAAVSVCSKLLERKERVMTVAAETVTLRNELAENLEQRGFQVVNGSANFVLLGAGLDAQRLTDFLKEKGILVRNCSASAMDDPLWGFVKISISSRVELEKLLAAVDNYRSCHCLAFDLDGTLIDTTYSYNVAVEQLVTQYSGLDLKPGELEELEEKGGFNDTWDKAHELVKRRGVAVSREEVVKKGQEIYYKIAPTAERLMIDRSLLRMLGKRFRLFVVSGRTRSEFDCTWADRLNDLFERIYCRDDVDNLQPKPSPDYLNHTLLQHSLTGGIYIGNTVDDMWSARDAGFGRIGVASVHAPALLEQAGAQLVLSNVNDLAGLFRIRQPEIMHLDVTKLKAWASDS